LNLSVSTIRAILFVGAATLLLGAPALLHAQGADAARDATALAEVVSAQEGRAVRRVFDGKVETYFAFAAGEALSLAWPEEAGVRMAYVKWYAPPDSAILVQTGEDGAELSRETIGAPLYNDCCPLLPEARGLTLVSEGGMRLAELTLYTAGALPDGVYDWRPPADKADLLVVSAHCDDELLFFGGTIPYYAGERGFAVQVAYMANGDRARVDEALSGLWHAGVRNAPVFLPFRDVYTSTLKHALIRWGEEETTGALVSLIRRFRPEVIVTHDLNGEYGHGAHMATAFCTVDAVPLAAHEAAFPDSAAAYGAWQAQKLYLHLYAENRITMDWNRPLASFGGKTALTVANEAYHMHVSQLEYHGNVYGAGKYSSLEYGLAFSAVGPDEAKDDFFEHIDPARLSGYAAPTPELAAAPTPEPAPAPAREPSPAPEMEAPTETKPSALPLPALIPLALIAAAAVAALLRRRKRRKNGA